jgi:hypothetical protein
MSSLLDSYGVEVDDLRKVVDKSLFLNFKPHTGQKRLFEKILPAPYGQGKKRGFVRNGRKWGKSKGAMFLSHWWSFKLGRATRNFILAPLYKQAREIYWDSRDLQDFMSIDGARSPLISSIDNQDTRISFFNGSFIKIDGSDNYAAQRGWNPDLVIADEYADFDPGWLRAMIPNLASRDATLLFLGTPPEALTLADGKEHIYVSLDKEFQDRVSRGHNVFWMHEPSWNNDALFPEGEDSAWLQEEKARLFSRGEEDVWEREYGAHLIQGGASYVFPMFSHENILSEAEIWSIVQDRQEQLEPWILADPGTRECFAVGLFLLDRYRGELFLIDEIYAQSQWETSVGFIYPRMIEAACKFYSWQEWDKVYDEAALWFANEVLNHHDPSSGWIPTQKARMRIESSDAKPFLSAIKDLFLTKRFFISSKCYNAISEIKSYQKRANGQIPKGRDHLIDIIRYLLHSSHFSLLNLKQKERVLSIKDTRSINALVNEEFYDEVGNLFSGYTYGDLLDL